MSGLPPASPDTHRTYTVLLCARDDLFSCILNVLNNKTARKPLGHALPPDTLSAREWLVCSHPHDLYQYVINNPSPYKGSDLKAFKSLDAYKYDFVSSWVTCLHQWIIPGAGGRHLITAKVCLHFHLTSVIRIRINKML